MSFPKQIGIKELEKHGAKLAVIESYGDITLVFNESDGIYYAKGPFARWDADCYLKLDFLKTREEVASWFEKLKEANKNY